MRATMLIGVSLLAMGAALTAQQSTYTNSVGMEFVIIKPGRMTVGVFHPTYAKPVDPNAPAAAGRGGRGGVGTTLAPQVRADGDANKDGRIDRAEFVLLAGRWFDRMDAAKAGSLNPAAFAQAFASVTAPATPAPAAGAAGAGRAGGGGGGAAGRGGAGPTMFTAADANRDGAVTKDELTALFGKWFATWDAVSPWRSTVSTTSASTRSRKPSGRR